MRLIISIAILAVSALPALADRQVTEDERAKLAAAVQAERVLAANSRWMKTISSLKLMMRSARMERSTTSSLICKCG